MRRKSVVIGAMALVALGAAGYGIYMLGMQRGMGMATAPKASADTAAAAIPQTIAQGEEATRRHIATGIKAGDMDPVTGSKVLYYHDPMVPGNTIDNPAKSPFINMMMVPV